ncbi:MAG: hypothetical protein ACTS3F_04395 [Phycisphaerales bacterium]
MIRVAPGSTGRARVRARLAGRRRSAAVCVLVALCGWLSGGGVLGGCASTVRPAQEALASGDVDGALALIERDPGNQKSGSDAVLYWLEYGSVLHHAGRFDRSTEALLEAERLMIERDNAPETRLSEEAAALVTNPGAVAYRGKSYDRVMSPVLRGLNALLSGDAESPRQAFNEAALRLADVVAARQGLIDAENAARAGEAARSREFAAADRTLADPRVRSRLDESYGDLERFSAYGAFGNPFAELLHAVYLMARSVDGGDLDRARTMLRRVAGMVPENKFVLEDLAAAEGAVSGATGGAVADGPVAGVTYLFYATGVAPRRVSERIDLPLFLFNDTVDYVGVAVPRLVFDHRAEGSLVLVAGDRSASTELVSDMDRIVASEFRLELPGLLRQSIASAIVKAASAWAINETVRSSTSDQDDWIALGTRIALIGYQYAQNTTDLRTWATLPKRFEYARLPTPSSGRVVVQRPDGTTIEFEVDPSRTTIIYARSVGAWRPLLCRAVGVD